MENLPKKNLKIWKPLLETDIIAELKGATDKTIALHAGIDALPVTEQNTLTYTSKSEEKMHAYGHDGHSAILVGTAHVLAKF